MKLSDLNDVFKIVGAVRYGFNIDAGAGDDLIVTSWGDDRILGGRGNDDIFSPGGKDALIGGAGDDSIIFGTYRESSPFSLGRLVGGEGNDSLIAFSKATMFGGAGDDRLISYSSNSKLIGGAGNDIIVGTGKDIMTGGDGSDIFSVGNYTGYGAHVRITDFSMTHDRLDISQLADSVNGQYERQISEDEISIHGDNIWIKNTDGIGYDVILGVGEEIALIGVHNAVSAGILILEAGKG